MTIHWEEQGDPSLAETLKPAPVGPNEVAKAGEQSVNAPQQMSVAVSTAFEAATAARGEAVIDVRPDIVGYAVTGAVNSSIELSAWELLRDGNVLRGASCSGKSFRLQPQRQIEAPNPHGKFTFRAYDIEGNQYEAEYQL